MKAINPSASFTASLFLAVLFSFYLVEFSLFTFTSSLSGAFFSLADFWIRRRRGLVAGEKKPPDPLFIATDIPSPPGLLPSLSGFAAFSLCFSLQTSPLPDDAALSQGIILRRNSSAAVSLFDKKLLLIVFSSLGLVSLSVTGFCDVENGHASRKDDVLWSSFFTSS